MLSIAVFVWFSTVSLSTASGVELPTFQGPYSCPIGYSYSAYFPSDSSDIVYVSRCPFANVGEGAICFPNGGRYAVNMQLGLQPGPAAEGWVEIDSTYGASSDYPPNPSHSQYLLHWVANSGYTLNQGAVVIKADAGECYRLRYGSSGAATVNPDQRASRLTIYRLGS